MVEKDTVTLELHRIATGDHVDQQSTTRDPVQRRRHARGDGRGLQPRAHGDQETQALGEQRQGGRAVHPQVRQGGTLIGDHSIIDNDVAVEGLTDLGGGLCAEDEQEVGITAIADNEVRDDLAFDGQQGTVGTAAGGQAFDIAGGHPAQKAHTILAA